MAHTPARTPLGPDRTPLCRFSLIRFFGIAWLLWMGMASAGWAQVNPNDSPLGTTPVPDSSTNKKEVPIVKPGQANPYNNSPTNAPTVDTGKVVTLPLPGDTARTDTSKGKKAAKPGDIKTTVNYQARDSIVFNVRTREARMYGETNTDYGDINLKADKVVVDWTTGILDAEGSKDSIGKDIGVPLFIQGGDKYQSHKMRYNFKTRRGLIKQVVTQQGDGYLHGETVKRQDDQNFYVKNAEYTTCNLEHPHFYIKSYKMKMVPNKKILSGPFNLYISDVPTPLGFAFGFFPIPKYKSSGLIFPTYGESADRGFFLRNGGYYLALSPYFDLKLLGEIYSRGGFGFYPQSAYMKRYKYSGNVSLRYNRRTTDVTGPLLLQGEDFWLEWSHRPQTRGNSSFSASVNVGTNTYNQRNSMIRSNYISSSFTSTVSYSKTFAGTPFSLNVSGRTQQNVQAKTINIDLPDVSFNMNRIFPFRGKSGSGGKGAWYKNISVAYTLTAKNSITNIRSSFPYSNLSGVEILTRQFSQADTVIGTGGTQSLIPFTRGNLPDLLRQAQIGMRHSVPISTTFKVLRFFNLSPSLNYSEVWYPRRLRYTYTPYTRNGVEHNAITVDTVNGFNRFNDFSASAGLSTQIFGTFYFRRGRMQAIRHMIVPTVSFSYKPDFSKGTLNYWSNVQADPTGGTIQLNPYQGFLYGAPGRGKQAALSFSVNNTLEAKVRSKTDTGAKAPGTPVKYDKKKLIDNLSFNFSYNIAADSQRLSPINWQVNRTFNRFTFLLNGQVDPYAYVQRDVEGREGERNLYRTNDYSFQRGQGMGKVTNVNMTVNVNLNPAAGKSQTKSLPRKTLSQAQQQELDFINANPNLFVDFNIPWNLQIGYNANYRPLLTGSKKYDIYQNLMLTGDVSLSENWKIGASAPYDFRSKKFSSTTINVYRNLHCWEMRFFVQVFGLRPSYQFDINVKASILQDLKLSKRNSFYDR